MNHEVIFVILDIRTVFLCIVVCIYQSFSFKKWYKVHRNDHFSSISPYQCTRSRGKLSSNQIMTHMVHRILTSLLVFSTHMVHRILLVLSTQRKISRILWENAELTSKHSRDGRFFTTKYVVVTVQLYYVIRNELCKMCTANFLIKMFRPKSPAALTTYPGGHSINSRT